MIFLQCIALAFFTALAVTGFMVRAGLGDIASDRSAHKNIIPTGGGVGLVASFGVVGVALGYLNINPELSFKIAPILSLVFAVAMLGLIDDIYALPARLKFGILVLICGAAVYIIGPVTSFPILGKEIKLPYLMGVSGSILWIFVVVNAVNFMDGANGFMGSVMAIASFALFVISIICGAQDAAVLSLILCGALLGFLPYNLRRNALIFSGDVGALTVGFVYACAVLLFLSHTQNTGLIYTGPLLILLFLTEVFLTLIRRARGKEDLLKAHNKHIYQRLIRSGISHLKVTMLYGFITLALSSGIVFAVYTGFTRWDAAFWGLVVATITAYAALSHKLPD